MVAANINVIKRLQYFAECAAQVGKQAESAALLSAVTMVERAIERAAAVETLRDRIAMQALNGLLENGRHARSADSELAKRAYQLADEMIIARKEDGTK